MNALPFAIGAAALLLLRQRATAATAQSVPVRYVGQDYQNPTAAAGLLARSVLAVVKGINVPRPATDATPYVTGQTDAARRAVRAGDATYGHGGFDWWLKTGDTSGLVPSGWTMPNAPGVDPDVNAQGAPLGITWGALGVADGIPGSGKPYNVGTDLQALAGWGP